MPQVTFAQSIQTHVPCPPQTVEGATVREALEASFRADPRLRGYVLDEHGGLRFHVAIFVDGKAVSDRTLRQTITADARVFVVQALSGG
ncbi:MAG: MoaD/ThiS family protein [Planctomycetota bacterium]